ncbi:unnamed protein product [Mucor hiemalis]
MRASSDPSITSKKDNPSFLITIFSIAHDKETMKFLFLAAGLFLCNFHFVHSASWSMVNCKENDTARKCLQYINKISKNKSSGFSAGKRSRRHFSLNYSGNCSTFDEELIQLKNCENCKTTINTHENKSDCIELEETRREEDQPEEDQLQSVEAQPQEAQLEVKPEETQPEEAQSEEAQLEEARPEEPELEEAYPEEVKSEKEQPVEEQPEKPQPEKIQPEETQAKDETPQVFS